jgi:hypothetical protein
MMRTAPSIQKGQRASDKCRKTTVNEPESFGNEVDCSCSEQDINEMEGRTPVKSSRLTLFLPCTRLWGH